MRVRLPGVGVPSTDRGAALKRRAISIAAGPKPAPVGASENTEQATLPSAPIRQSNITSPPI
jgi:hypothetical protein